MAEVESGGKGRPQLIKKEEKAPNGTQTTHIVDDKVVKVFKSKNEGPYISHQENALGPSTVHCGPEGGRGG